MLLLWAFLIDWACCIEYFESSWQKLVYSVLTFKTKELLPRTVANIKIQNIQRTGARAKEFCIELHPAADLELSTVTNRTSRLMMMLIVIRLLAKCG
jgi:hypothetical protein